MFFLSFKNTKENVKKCKGRGFCFYVIKNGEHQLHSCPVVKERKKDDYWLDNVTDSLILTLQYYTETAFYALKRLQTKKRKIVDRRASKSRKIR
jgi:hypothetical protein